MGRLVTETARAVAGGVAGTAVMSLFLLVMQVQTRSAIGVFAAIARFVRLPGQLAVGFLVFVIAGSALWPLVFLALKRYVPVEGDVAAKGALFGVVLWIPFVLTGRGDLTGPIVVLYAGFTLLAHLAYGFTLGAVYARFVPADDAGRG